MQILDSSTGASNTVMVALLLFGAAGCSPSGLKSSAAAASTDGPAAATTTDYCALFTTNEIAAALGKPVKAGHVAPVSFADGCQWDALDAPGKVLIQVLPAGLWYDLSGHTGQRSAPGIGEKAYIGTSPLGGVQAGAVAADAFYHVLLDPAPADDRVTGILSVFIRRRAH